MNNHQELSMDELDAASGGANPGLGAAVEFGKAAFSWLVGKALDNGGGVIEKAVQIAGGRPK